MLNLRRTRYAIAPLRQEVRDEQPPTQALGGRPEAARHPAGMVTTRHGWAGS